MQDAVPVGIGAMAAVLGLETHVIEETCSSVSLGSADFLVEVANYNGPDQTVISGTVIGVDKAMEILKEKGAKRVLPLAVSAPFHCRLMMPAAEKLAQHLGSIQFETPLCAFINNVEADLQSDPLRIRELLAEQVVAPVRFTQMLMRLRQLGVDNYLEIGPGKVLSGIVRRTLSEVVIKNRES
jgi:[acyl-carrier-protein] S-malonyltransferase